MIAGHLFKVPGATTSGEWTFVVGKSFIVALLVVHDVGAPASFGPLMDRVDARVEELVAAMPKENAEGSFAIVAEITASGDQEAGVTVVVRGDTAVDIFSVGGWRRVTDQGIRPWMLADFQATTAIVIGRSTEPLEDINRLERTAVPESSRVFTAARLAWSVRSDPAEAIGQAEPGSKSPEHQGAKYQGAEQQDTEQPATEPEGRFAPHEGPVIDTLDDATVLVHRSRESSWAPTPVPDTSTTRQTPAEVYRFRVGGQEVALTEVSYLGRKPRPPRIGSTAGSRLVTVESGTREVSSTHLKLEQVGNTVVVTDLASTNGTIVKVPGAAPERLRPAVSLVVAPGTRLEIGDGNIVEILKIVSESQARAAGPSKTADR